MNWLSGMKKRGKKAKKKDVGVQKASSVKTQVKNEEVNTMILPASKEEAEMDVEVEDMQEPETGQEPAGPDQSLPVSSEAEPPAERKATSYINVGFLNTFSCSSISIGINHFNL